MTMAASSQPFPVTVLGAGAWGTALACAFAKNTSTVLWGRDETLMQQMRTDKVNARYLPGVALTAGLQLESDLTKALAHVSALPGKARAQAGLVVLGTPMAGLQASSQRVLDHLRDTDSHILGLVWTCKGLDAHTEQLPHEIVEDLLKSTGLSLPVGALSGPSFAREVAQGLPVALTIASHDQTLCDAVIQVLHAGNVRVYDSPDVLGVGVGGALKNIMAIACGISDGLQLGHNARAALITRGLAEIRRFGVALGAQETTFSGLTGLGDLVLTATGELSRNRQLGFAIGQGQQAQALLASGVTAEGARCATAVLERARNLGVSMPITAAVHAVLFESLSATECVARLMARDPQQDS